MEDLLALLAPLVRLISTLVGVILFFLYLVRPLLNYLLANHEIERQKKENAAILEAFLNDEAEDHPPGDQTGLPGDQPQGRKPPGKETMTRLASSDPEKAGDLVKKWIHSD